MLVWYQIDVVARSCVTTPVAEVLVSMTSVPAVIVVKPVNVGLVNMVALLSLVTLPRPTCVAVTPLTVPVNVGLVNMVAFDSLVTLPRPTLLALRLVIHEGSA
jgi:hypothetical protein